MNPSIIFYGSPGGHVTLQMLEETFYSSVSTGAEIHCLFQAIHPFIANGMPVAIIIIPDNVRHHFTQTLIL